MILKFSPSIVGYTIIACRSSMEGVAYSLRVQSSSIALLFYATQEVNAKRKKEGRKSKEKRKRKQSNRYRKVNQTIKLPSSGAKNLMV